MTTMQDSPFWNSLIVKLFLSICVIVLPLIIIMTINSYYSIDVIRNQVAQSNQKMLNLHKNELEKQLENISNYVYQLSNQADLLTLQEDSEVDKNTYNEAKIRLHQTISKNAEFYRPVDSLFVHVVSQDDMIYTQKFGDTYTERLETSSEIKSLLNKGNQAITDGVWTVYKGEKQYYLLYTIKNDDVFVGAWLNADKLLTPFNHINFGELGKMLITTTDFQPINHQDFLKEEEIQLKAQLDTYLTKGNSERFIVMNEPSQYGNFHLIALIPEGLILEELPFIQRISLYIAIGSIIFLLIFVILMRNIFLTPIVKIVQAMKQLREGKLDTRLPKAKSSTEFEVMNDSFNRMISDIQDLKIDVYEKQINLQKAELQHLQLQINPHFFLNSLNIIYNLATVKDFELIQQMSKSLSNYFRFMFKSNSYFVRLQDEMSHTENYLHIQQLRFPDAFIYHVEIDSKWNDVSVPPLMIQSLVENTIKHGLNLDDVMEIHIRVFQEFEEDHRMMIEVRDTGDGFANDILPLLNKDEPIKTESGERIGLWNIKRRLALLYGEGQTDIVFENRGGAMITIKLPIQQKEIDM